MIEAEATQKAILDKISQIRRRIDSHTSSVTRPLNLSATEFIPSKPVPRREQPVSRLPKLNLPSFAGDPVFGIHSRQPSIPIQHWMVSRGFDALGKSEDSYGALLIPIILRKLSAETRTSRSNLARSHTSLENDEVIIVDRIHH